MCGTKPATRCASGTLLPLLLLLWADSRGWTGHGRPPTQTPSAFWGCRGVQAARGLFGLPLISPPMSRLLRIGQGPKRERGDWPMTAAGWGWAFHGRGHRSLSGPAVPGAVPRAVGGLGGTARHFDPRGTNRKPSHSAPGQTGALETGAHDGHSVSSLHNPFPKGAHRALCPRCARAVRKGGCFPPPVATGPEFCTLQPLRVHRGFLF